MFNQNIISQPPDEDGPYDEVNCDKITCPCEVWERIQKMRWSPLKPETSGTINLADNDGNDQSSEVFTDGQVISNKKVNINGHFTIDNSITFKQCEITISSSAVLTINSTYKLSLNQSIISGNYNLWDGIVVSENAQLNVESTYIQDAYSAIVAKSSSVVRISHSKFNKNLMSVSTSLSYTAPDPVIYLEESHFNCTGDLLPLGQGEPGGLVKEIAWDKKSFAAFYIGDINFNVSASGCEFSSIGNHANGILAFDGGVAYEHILLYNIKESAAYNYPYEGYGIALNIDNFNNYHAGENIFGEGLQAVNGIEDPDFRNVDYGIVNVGGEIRINRHWMKNTDVGIYADRIHHNVTQDNRFQSFNSKGVHITNSSFLFNPGSGQVLENYIFNNNFTPDEGATGIHTVRNYGTKADNIQIKYFYSIENNNFHGKNYVGIRSLRDYNTSFLRNDFKVSSNSEKMIGIQVSGGNIVKTFNNVISPTGPSSGNEIGIQYINSDFSLVRCNNIMDLGLGFNWVGANRLQIYENTSDNNRLGWRYEEASSTDEQVKTSNIWIPRSGFPVKNRHLDDYNDKTVENSRIWVGSNTFPTQYDPEPSVPSTLVSTNFIYTPQQRCDQNIEPRRRLSSADSLIAIGQGQGTSFPTAYQWIQELDLYTKIQEFQLTFPPSSVYYSFVQQCQNNNISAFYQAIRDFRNAQKYTTYETNVIKSNYENIESTIETSKVQDSLYRTSNISFDSLVQYRIQQNALIHNYRDNINNVMNDYYTDRNSKLSTIIGDLQVISTSNYLASELKRAYQISARYSLKQLTSQDSSIIFSFDGACLEEYHDAAIIYQALSSLLGNENSIVYSCDQPPQLRSQEENLIVRVYPNPTDDIVNIQFKKKYTGNLKLVNLQGQVVIDIEFANSYNEILNISSIQSGIYYLSLNELGEPIKIIKL